MVAGKGLKERIKWGVRGAVGGGLRNLASPCFPLKKKWSSERRPKNGLSGKRSRNGESGLRILRKEGDEGKKGGETRGND